jgi:DNA-binding transcriptional LysR family regulator
MVRAGLGVTAMPRIALGELNMKGLISAPFAPRGAKRRIGIITRQGRKLSPAAQAYVELLFEEAAAGPYNRAQRKRGG